MALAFTSIGDNAFTGSGTSRSTAGALPYQDNRLYLAALTYADAASARTADSISGGGITWVKIVETAAFSFRAMSLWRGLVTSGAFSEVTTFTFSGNISNLVYSITEVTGMDTSGTNGSGAIVQSDVRSTTVADVSYSGVLSAFADAVNNATFTAIAHSVNEVQTEEAGFTELTDFGVGGSAAMRMGVEYKIGQDLSPSYSWTSGGARGAVSAEIKMAIVASSPKVPKRIMVKSQAVHRASRW